MSRLFYQGLGKTTSWENLPNATSITYDDVTLLTRNSDINSRSEVDTTVQFGPFTLTLPITNAPMDTVAGEEMMRALAKAGGLGFLPRHKGNVDEVVSVCKRLSTDGVPCVYSIGLKNALEEARLLKKFGAQMVLIDIAHGGLEKVKEAAVEIKKSVKLEVVTGNIGTYEQAVSYKEKGLEYARVGVGGGAVCITREVAGVGLPVLTSVFETVAAGLTVIADQNIRGPKDVAKAIAGGATAVMIGSLFAGTDEAPKIRDEKGRLIYRGQASPSYMKDNKTAITATRAPEGVEVAIKEKGPVQNVLDNLAGGLRSAMTYVGARNMKEFQEKAIFNLISQASHMEGMPHMKFRTQYPQDE